MAEATLPTNPRFVNHIGETFGRLTIIGYAGKRHGNHHWLCQCSCAAQTVKAVSWPNLYIGNTVSCGCRKREGLHRCTHRMTHTAVYRSWQHMKYRCLNPNSEIYRHYGGRGITVCKRWMSFENFYADMGPRPPRTSLERKDNSKGYEPGNCVWAPADQQCRNKRSTRRITHQGITLCASDWMKRIGLGQTAFYARLRQNLPLDQLLAPPIPPGMRRKVAHQRRAEKAC